MGFLEQFLNVFSELKGKNLYLSGESVSYSRLSRASTYLMSSRVYSTQGSVR